MLGLDDLDDLDGFLGFLGRVHDNVHDDMNMSLIMDDHSPVHSYDQHIIPHDQ